MSRSIAVMTSGGDAPGMNAAIRGVVRAGISRGWQVWLVEDGWEGAIEGRMRVAAWSDVAHILQLGGTVLGTARSSRFRTKEGRGEACKQFAAKGIDGLVCIGGDGSLTGANLLREEWADHIASLGLSSSLPPLDVVGLVGSIDNDLIGFTQTIGADSALHRIISAVDSIISTALSHGRTFVIEVMGRSSGYLALAASMICGADWVFIPERPVGEMWAQKMCNQILAGRHMHRRKSIIILAEGAITTGGQRITAEQVKDAIEKELHHDTRITTLGHVQRGGSPSAFDRFQATVLAVAAVDELASHERGSRSVVVGLEGYSVESKPLMECVRKTQVVAGYLDSKQFDLAFAARGSAFAEFWKILVTVSGALQVPHGIQANQAVAVATVGAPAPGMNHCCRVAVRLLMERGYRVLLVHGGFDGMEQHRFEVAEWMSCSGWAGAGGAFLGTGRKTPHEAGAERIRVSLQERNVKALVVIGGYEAYSGALALHKVCGKELAIAVVPATISKNCVGTQVSIGMDKASNNLMTSCDQIKQSCIGYEKRVFVVESIGRSCGFQSLFGAIASGADLVMLPERSPKLEDMEKTVNLMRHRFTNTTAQIGLIVNSESASEIFTTSFIRRLHETSLKDIKVSAREALLAGLQQGGDPSPMDRIFSGRLALAAVDHISRCLTDAASVESEAVACGLERDERVYTPLSVFEKQTDHKLRRPLDQPWLLPFLHAFDSVTFPPQRSNM